MRESIQNLPGIRSLHLFDETVLAQSDRKYAKKTHKRRLGMCSMHFDPVVVTSNDRKDCAAARSDLDLSLNFGLCQSRRKAAVTWSSGLVGAGVVGGGRMGRQLAGDAGRRSRLGEAHRRRLRRVGGHALEGAVLLLLLLLLGLLGLGLAHALPLLLARHLLLSCFFPLSFSFFSLLL